MFRRKSKVVKVLLVAGLVFILIMAVGMIFASQGLSKMQELTINDVNLSGIPDGTYTGEFDRYRWSESVEVTLQGGRIVQIQSANNQKLQRELIERILERQTLQVDAMSGATVSSNAFLKAVENALTGTED